MMVNAELTTGQNAESGWLKRPQPQMRHLHHIPSSRLMDHREEGVGRLCEPQAEKELSKIVSSGHGKSAVLKVGCGCLHKIKPITGNLLAWVREPLLLAKEQLTVGGF